MEKEMAKIMPLLTARGSFARLDVDPNTPAFDMRIPVIVISASDDAQIRERARELGAVSFFRKPVDDQALLDAIGWAISGTKRDQT